MGRDEKGEGCDGEGDVGGMRFVVVAEKPVGHGAKEEGDRCEDEWAMEGSEGWAVEVEEVAEGESVVGGVLMEEGGEIDAWVGWVGVEDEKAYCQRGDGTED